MRAGKKEKMRHESQIKYRNLRRDDEEQVLRLVKDTFLEYNSRGVSRGAVHHFLKGFSPTAFSRFLGQVSLVAEESGRIVGFVRGRGGRISNLFVFGNYHRRGIGTGLIRRCEGRLAKSTDAIRVRSSLSAVEFYSRKGYKKTTGRRLFCGIPIQPMKKRLE